MNKIILMTTIILIASCAHHADVRPNSSGTHSVKIKTELKEGGYKNAMGQANHFCNEKSQGKSAFVVKEGYKYTGSMKEETYKNTKTASKVATGVGSAAFVFGGKKESSAGGILGLGGAVADSVAGSGYTYTMTFNCK